MVEDRGGGVGGGGGCRREVKEGRMEERRWGQKEKLMSWFLEGMRKGWAKVVADSL